MFNDFVIVGPESDPAGVRGVDSATEALTTIAEAEATFVSRGDNSGTHTTERNLWEAAGADPGGDWDQDIGTGMGEALNVANQQVAYAPSDRGTFTSRRSEVDLVVLVQSPIEGGPETLANPYGIMAVIPGVHDNANYDLSIAYVGWITSPGAQDAISNGLRVRQPWSDRLREELWSVVGSNGAPEAVTEALDLVGLSDKIHREARSLPGGEAQRVSFARALAYDPEYLLFDEPTSDFDARNADLIEDSVLEARDRGIGVAIATHDMQQAERIAEVGPAEQVFENPTDERTEKFVPGELVY